MSDRARELLELFYLPEMIYLREGVEYSVEKKSVRGYFHIPGSHTYSCQPLGYVTGSQYLMCLSQLAYILLGYLVRDKTADFDFVDFKTFKRLMTECKMWFREIRRLRFLKNVQKDTEFELTLTLKKVSTPRGFAVCILEIGGVARDELEFVAPLNNKG